MRAAKAMATGIALVALVAGAGAVAVSRVDPVAVADFLTEAARQASGREVVVRGATELALFPAPTLIAENVIFGNAPWSLSPDMARVKRMEARVDFLPLFLGQLRVSRFRLLEPHVLLERGSKGRRNWDFERVANTPPGSGERRFLTRMQTRVRMVVSEIQIIDGTFSYREGGLTHTVRIPALAARGDVTGGPLDLSGRGQFKGRGWKLTGRVGELSALLRNQPYEMAFTLTGVGIAIHGKGGVERPLDGSGLRMDVALDAESGTRLLGLAGLDIPLPGRVEAKAVLSDVDRRLRLDALSASTRIEGGRVTASGSVTDLVGLRGVNIALGLKARSLAGIGKLAGMDLPAAGPAEATATISNPKGRFRMDALAARIALRGATVELDGRIANLVTLRGVDVGMNLRAASLRALSRYLGAPLPAVGPVAAKARVSRTRHGYKLAGIDARVGRSDANGELFVYPHRKRLRVVGSLRAGQLDLDEFLPRSTGSSARRVFSPERFSLAWLQRLDGEISVHARKLRIQSLEMERVKAGMALADGQLLFTPRGRLGGGKFEARLAVDARTARPHVAMRLRGKGIGLGNLSEQIYATRLMDGGAADVNIDVAGRGRSVQELMAGLSGGLYVAAGKAEVHNERLEKVSGDVVTAVLSTVAMQSTEEKTTHVRCSVVRVPVRNGLVSVDRTIAMETSRAAMSIHGSIDLRDEALDLGVNLVGRRGPSLGAGSLSGLVRVRGTMAEPHVGADAAGVAGAAATVAGAVATGGLSLLAQGLISQIAADRSTCRTALEINTGGQTRAVAFGGASARDEHRVEAGPDGRERRRDTTTADDGAGRRAEDGS